MSEPNPTQVALVQFSYDVIFILYTMGAFVGICGCLYYIHFRNTQQEEVEFPSATDGPYAKQLAIPEYQV